MVVAAAPVTEPVVEPVVVAAEDGLDVAPPVLALEVGACEDVDAQVTEAGRLVTPLDLQSDSAYLVAAT